MINLYISAVARRNITLFNQYHSAFNLPQGSTNHEHGEVNTVVMIFCFYAMD